MQGLRSTSSVSFHRGLYSSLHPWPIAALSTVQSSPGRSGPRPDSLPMPSRLPELVVPSCPPILSSLQMQSHFREFNSCPFSSKRPSICRPKSTLRHLDDFVDALPSQSVWPFLLCSGNGFSGVCRAQHVIKFLHDRSEFVHIYAVERAGLNASSKGLAVVVTDKRRTRQQQDRKTFAGIRSRKQCGASSQGFQEEDAT